MKNLVIRAFVVALVLTGATATAHSKAPGHVAVAGSYFPVPLCPWNDPNACGID